MSRLRVSENGEKVKIRTTNDCTLLWHVGCGCMWGVGVIVSVYTPHTHTHTQKPSTLLLALGENQACHSRQGPP